MLLSIITIKKNLENLMMFGPEDPMLISEIFNNTTKMGLQVQLKKMKFEVK